MVRGDRRQEDPRLGRVAAEARADGAGPLAIDVGLFEHRVGRGQQVAHRLPAPVATDLVVPLLAKARKTAAIDAKEQTYRFKAGLIPLAVRRQTIWLRSSVEDVKLGTDGVLRLDDAFIDEVP